MSRPASRPGGGLERARALLRRHWGHHDFRPAQRPVVSAMLAGRDVLAVLPTGGGKSVCFQVPALCADGLTLVVSPLISLMEDQVEGARRRGLPAAALTSSTPVDERRRTGERVRTGAVRLLYVAPERLSSGRFLRTLEGVRVARVAVDEAHCISEWGHDFRPAYRRIGRFVRRLGGRGPATPVAGRPSAEEGEPAGAPEADAPRRGGEEAGDGGQRGGGAPPGAVRPPLAALTATATPRTRADVRRSLGLVDPVRVVAGVDRPELRWSAERAPSLGTAATRVLHAVRGTRGAAIVYTPGRRRAVRVAEALRRLGVPAAPYHAGLPARARSRVQEAFLAGERRVVCATSAFGMGIDHASVRLVCHLGIPGSLEAYVQEAGRAGRDRRRSRCLLVSHPGDARLQRALAERSWPSARLLDRVWRAMPEGRPLSVGELRRRVGRGAEAEGVAAALRLLARFGCVRERRGTGRGDPVEGGGPGGAAGDRDRAGPGRKREHGQTGERSRPDGAPDVRWVRGPDVLRRRIDFGAPRRGLRRARRRLEAMRGYVRSRSCRRAAIAAYFGEEPPACRGCDRCGPG